MRHVIDQRNLTIDSLLALHRVTLSWAVQKGNRFVLGVDRAAYADVNDFTAICSLGRITSAAPTEGTNGGSATVAWPPDLVRVEGSPDERLVAELTGRRVPGRASGETCPVDLVWIFLNGRTIYSIEDYGRAYILSLEQDEYDDLSRALIREGLSTDVLTAAPPYVAD